MLTLREIAQQIGKPETTVRDTRWKVDRYLIDKQVAGKRFVQFTDTAVDVFRDYAIGKDQGLDDAEIHEQLSAKYPVTIKEGNDGKAQRSRSDDVHGRTTTPPLSQTTSIDIYTRLQVTSFQIIQQQAQALTTALDKLTVVIDQNQKLIEQNQKILEALQARGEQTPPVATEKKSAPTHHTKPKHTTGANKRTQRAKETETPPEKKTEPPRISLFKRIFG